LGNWSPANNSNIPTSYWIFPNEPVLNQAILRFEREADTVQTDHIDWGFRSTWLYGTDYRYMTAGGWFSGQLLEQNQKYGFDPTEQYLNVYVPRIAQGMVLTAGRWIATPDIETQFRTGQLPRHAFDPVHVRHLHPDGHHGDLDAQQTVDDPGGGARRNRRGAVVQGRDPDGHARSPVGVYDAKAFELGKKNFLWMGGLDLIFRF